MGFEKQWVKGLTSMVQNYFDLGMYTSSMSCLNADLIAVSLAYCKDLKKLPENKDFLT